MAKAKGQYDVLYSIGATDDTAAGIKTATDSLTSPIERIERKWNNLNKALGIGAGILIAREGFRKLNSVAHEFEEFLEQQDKESGFANLAKSVNTNTQRIVNDLKEASHETLTYNEILDSASEALFKGLQPDQLPKLMELARASTKITGRDLRSTFDSVTQAVVTHSERMMRSQGIMIDYDKHLNILAKSLGLKKSELNDAQEAQAFYNAALEAGSKLAVKTASDIDSLGDAYKRSKAKIVDALRDAKDMAFELISSPVVTGLSKVVDLLDRLSYMRPEVLPQFDKTAENLEKLKGLLDRMPNATNLKDLQFNFPAEFSFIPQKEQIDQAIQYTDEYWDKWDENMSKAADNYGKSILEGLKQADEHINNVIVNGQSLEKLVDNQFKAIEEGWKQGGWDPLAKSAGQKLGESLGDGFAYGAQRTISDGLFAFMTNEFNAKSALTNVLRMGARVLSDSFAEAFLNATGLKNMLTNFFTALFTGVATGMTGAAVGSGTGGAGGSGGVPSLTQGFYPHSARAAPQTNNTFNYYITDDPTLQKRINEGVRKSFRDNNLRQDVKGLS